MRSPERPDWPSSTHSSLFNKHRGPLPGVKHIGREANISAPSSVDVKNEWSYTATPVCLHVMHRDDCASKDTSFTSTFTKADLSPYRITVHSSEPSSSVAVTLPAPTIAALILQNVFIPS